MGVTELLASVQGEFCLDPTQNSAIARRPPSLTQNGTVGLWAILPSHLLPDSAASIISLLPPSFIPASQRLLPPLLHTQDPR